MKNHEEPSPTTSIVWITIEGAIGGGKTTLIKELSSHAAVGDVFKGCRVYFVKEPVDEIQQSGLLQKQYEDPLRWCYCAQTQFFHKRTKKFLECWDSISSIGNGGLGKEDSPIVIISERSILSDRIFWELQHDLKRIEEPCEYEAYKDLWNMWVNLYPIKPSLVVYLDVPVDVCMDRVKERNRDSEVSGISREYQEHLIRLHEKFLFNNGTGGTGEDSWTGLETMRVDATRTYHEDPAVLKEIAQEIYNKTFSS